MTDISVGTLTALLSVVARHDQREDLWWNENLEFAVDCSDVFYWASADAEPVGTLDDVALLDQAYTDTKIATYFGAALYAARRRGMRPQDPAIPEGSLGDLFRACGPERTKKDQG